MAVEATEFPDLARQYQVSGVPKTVVNDAVDILGALPEEMFLDQVLSALPEKRSTTEDTGDTEGKS